mmetsp:Transcript_41902/g.104167  ORF Transcript_41902/g.104167 Transcript_41902/m.104167 type:complete len:97 (-) Transcript_41902:138-428(-)
MDEAERRARAQGLLRVAVIAGVGSRGYYAKLGYHLEGEGLFMIKTLSYFAPGWHTALLESKGLLGFLFFAFLLSALSMHCWLWCTDWSPTCLNTVC